MLNRRILCLRLCALAAGMTAALSWGQMFWKLKTDYPSKNGKFLLQIDEEHKNLKLFSGKKLVWMIPWPQQAPPANALVTDDGRRVVLVDWVGGGWHGAEGGNGASLVVLGSEGRVVKEYTPEGVRMGDQYQVPGTHGLTRYTSLGVPDEACMFDAGQQNVLFLRSATLAADDADEMWRREWYVPTVVRLSDGMQIRPTADQVQKMRQPFATMLRADLGSKDPDKRFAAAIELASLQDRGAVSALKRMLNDPTVAKNYDGSAEKRHELQTSAAEALAGILGREAAPLIRPKLRSAKCPSDRIAFLHALQWTGVPPDNKTVAFLLSSSDQSDRQFILDNLERSDPRQAVRIARKLLKSRNEKDRSAAMSVIVRNGTESEIPLLMAELKNPEFGDLAAYGLARIKPKNLTAVFEREAKDTSSSAYWESIFELARRNNKSAQLKVVAWVNRYVKVKSDDPWPGNKMSFEEAAHILAEKRPDGARDALRKVLLIYDPWQESDLNTRGALAQLGETKHLDYLRAVAKGAEPKESPAPDYWKGGWPRRKCAIEWLGMVKDKGSLELLQSAADDPEWYVRESARKAL